MNRTVLHLLIFMLFSSYATAQNNSGKKWYEEIVDDYEREQCKVIESDSDGGEPDRYIDRPFYEKRDCQYLNIVSICVLDEHTVVECKYVSPAEGKHICINSASYIRDRETGYTYDLLESPELPIKPETAELAKGENYTFKLYFSPIPKTVSCVDVIENPYSSAAFNFYKVDVTGQKHQKERTKVVVKKVVVTPKKKTTEKKTTESVAPTAPPKKETKPVEPIIKEPETNNQILM